MTPTRIGALLAVVASGLSFAADVPRRFPQVQVRPLTLLGVWESAPTVVVAELRNPQPAGVQRVKKLPWPAPANVNTIYWCQGNLEIKALVKGQRPGPSKEFLWGTAKPGCALTASDDSRTVTRVWFIREEGKYIRPVVDGFGIYYINFYVPWDQSSARDPKQEFGELLLSPAARGTTPSGFSNGFFTPASTACFILGNARCIERIRALAALGDPDLRRAACDFLRSELQVTCER